MLSRVSTRAEPIRRPQLVGERGPRPGDVILAEVPRLDGPGNTLPHYLIVLEVLDDGGLLAVYTTSKKDCEPAGLNEFSEFERAACRFGRPTKVDPQRTVIYPANYLYCVTITGGRLPKPSLHRIQVLVLRARGQKPFLVYSPKVAEPDSLGVF